MLAIAPRYQLIILSWLTSEERRIYNELHVGKTISMQVRANRKSRGLTQWQLSRKAGVSWATIQRIERWYNVDYTVNTLLKIAKALDIAFVSRFVSWLELLTEAISAEIEPISSFHEDSLARNFEGS